MQRYQPTQLPPYQPYLRQPSQMQYHPQMLRYQPFPRQPLQMYYHPQMVRYQLQPNIQVSKPSVLARDLQQYFIDGTEQSKTSVPVSLHQTKLIQTTKVSYSNIQRRKACHWTSEEDKLLLALVSEFGARKWKQIAAAIGTGRTAAQVAQRWRKTLDPSLQTKKGFWTDQEDNLLRTLINIQGDFDAVTIDWRRISQGFDLKRSVKQCRERWVKHVCPTVNHKPWTQAEDKVILTMRKNRKSKNRWSDIARDLTGRNEDAVKRRYISLTKTKSKKRKSKHDSAADDKQLIRVKHPRIINL